MAISSDPSDAPLIASAATPALLTVMLPKCRVATMARPITSAIGLRQVFPVQTNSTRSGESGIAKQVGDSLAQGGRADGAGPDHPCTPSGAVYHGTGR